LLFWTECPGQEPTANVEPTVECLTTRQVAERLQVSTSVVVHLLASGKLSGTKVGDKWRIPVSAVREYIKAVSVKLQGTR
jgi:excisionase family DNA binding protein